MIRELDAVALTHDLRDPGLKAGDIGTVVLGHGGGRGFEVEFMTPGGETRAVSTFLAADVRPVEECEMPVPGPPPRSDG